eukprot:gene41871-51110_t
MAVQVKRLTTLWLKKLVPALVASQLLTPLGYADDNDSLQDQLKEMQKEQVSQQVANFDEQRRAGDSSLKDGFVSRSQVAKAMVTLLPTRSDIDPTQYPLGLTEAVSLDSAFDSDEAALLCSAVGRQEAPVASKKFKLKDVKFPLFLEMTTKDLMFPYTPEAWLASPLSQDNIAVTCVLDPDGRLATPEASDRYGFGISDHLTDADSGVVKRGEARVNINFKSDGRPYSSVELELLGRIDNELDRLGFSTQPTPLRSQGR